MGDLITTLDHIINFIGLIWFFVIFYLSVKKCFWREGKSKLILFLVTFFTGPLLTYYVAAIIITFAALMLHAVFNGFEDAMRWILSLRDKEFLILSALYAPAYLILSILYATWVGKWLKTVTKEPVIFLYLMFNTFFMLFNRSSGSGELFSVPYLREIADICVNIILAAALLIFYRLDVLALAKMARLRVKVEWKIFNVPPAIFVLAYSILVGILMLSTEEIDDGMMLVIYFFSTVIVFLFIWAFYVIIRNIMATDDAVNAKEEVKILSVEVMEALAHTIDAKDEYTRGHSIRVARYSRMIAEKLGLSAKECEDVYYMGLLHDIGKIGVPNEIINSTTTLSDDEYKVVKTHPGIGYDILAEIKSRPDLSIGAHWHHERYDGTGYPDGRAGEEIPLYARIIAVADSYDAMTSNRSYRTYMPQEKVRSEIEENTGSQFDPKIAGCMLAIMDADTGYQLHE